MRTSVLFALILILSACKKDDPQPKTYTIHLIANQMEYYEPVYGFTIEDMEGSLVAEVNEKKGKYHEFFIEGEFSSMYFLDCKEGPFKITISGNTTKEGTHTIESGDRFVFAIDIP